MTNIAGLRTIEATVGDDTSIVEATFDDSFDELDGSITAKIISQDVGSRTYGIGAEPTATIQVLDADVEPHLSISVASVIEGNDPNTNAEMVFTVSIDQQSFKDVRVEFSITENSTATKDIDFSGTPVGYSLKEENETYTLHFAKRSITNEGVVIDGVTSRTIRIPIFADTLDEDDETVFFLITNSINAAIPEVEVPFKIGTITDDDEEPTLTVSPGSGIEGTTSAGVIEFDWTIEPVSGREIIVIYETISGTAISDTDFMAISNATLKIPAGQTSGTIRVTTIADEDNEQNENFTLEFSNANNVKLASDSIFGTILNDDLVITIEKEHYPIGETNAEFYFVADAVAILDLEISYEYNYQYTNGEYLFTDWRESTATILSGSRYVMIQLLAFDKPPSSQEAPGSLNLRLLDSIGYRLGTTIEEDLSLQADSKTPLVSISRDGKERLYETMVNSSQQRMARFQVIARPIPDEVKTVNVWVTQEGDFIADPLISNGKLEELVNVNETTGIGILEIAIEDDTDGEEIDGSITATVQAGEHYHIGNFSNKASVTVLDDDGEDTMPEIAITSVFIDGVENQEKLTATEGSTIEIEIGSNIPVRSSDPLTINYDVSTVGQLFGTTYVGIKTTKISSRTNRVVIQFETIDDEVEEENGSLLFTLLRGDGYFLESTNVNDNTKEIMIKDDDPTLTISSQSILEGSGGNNTMRFEVAISSAPLEDVTVDFVASSGTAIKDADFIRDDGTLTFPAGVATPQPILVVINPDSIDEDDEEFNITLSNPTGGAKIGGTGIAVGTIEDDDYAPVLSINSEKIEEGDSGEKNITFTATLTHASSRNVTFEYSTIGITATAGEDYIAVIDEEATIRAGEVSLPINVKVKGDEINESDETFTVDLAIAVNATISESSGIGTGTIISDDTPAFHVVNTESLEDSNGLGGQIVFEITLSPAFDDNSSVQFTTVKGATDSATRGMDFEAVDKIVEFKVGERSKTVIVNLENDDLDEDDEEFTVRLSNNSDRTAIVGNGLAKGKILDNDGVINLEISDAEIIEGNSGETMMEFTVTFEDEKPSGRDVRVRYNTADLTSEGVADDETDYNPVIDGALLFIPGTTTRTLSIIINGDDEFEPDEEFYVVLSEATNATITRNIGTGIIRNDDPEIPRLNLETGQKTVYNEGEVVEISLRRILYTTPESEIELPITVTQNGDFIRWRNSNMITIDDDMKMIRIPTHDDEVQEQSGSITVSIEKAEGEYTVNPMQSSVTVMVMDNDQADSPPQPRIGLASHVANSILRIFDSHEPPEPNENFADLKPTVSVSAVVSQIDEGTPAEFDIVALGTIDRNLTIQFKITQVGDFIGGQTPSQVNLSQEHKHSRVGIETVDDALAEDDGQVALTLIESNDIRLGEQSTATVNISDNADRLRRAEAISAAGQDVLSELVGSIGARSISATTRRVRNAFTANGPVRQFELNGTDQITDILTAGGEMINGNSMSLPSILGSSSFTIDLFPEQGGISLLTIWGLGDFRDLQSSENEDSKSWNGDVFTGQIGFDASIGSNFLTGVSTSVIESDVDHTGLVDEGLMFRSSLTALNPYFGWNSANQDIQLRGIIGYGLGDIAVEQKNYETELLRSRFYTLGLSGDHRLYSFESFLGGGTTELSIRGNSWLTSQYVNGITNKINDMNTTGSHYQVTAVGSHQFSTEGGTSFKPTASIGLRRDQKNQDSIIGLELGTGLSFSNPLGLSITGNSSTLMVNYDKVQKWSLMGSLTYDHLGDKLGPLLEVSPSIGRTLDSNSKTLWSSEILGEMNELGQYQHGVGAETEFGFGFRFLDGIGVMTPFGGVNFADEAGIKYLFGMRVLSNSGLKLELENLLDVNTESKITQNIRVKGGFSW